MPRPAPPVRLSLSVRGGFAAARKKSADGGPTPVEPGNAGKDPVFVADKVEGLPKTQCWHIGEDDLKDVGEQPVKEYFADAMEAKPLE